MIFLWSSSNKIGSKIIQWGRNADCSHFGILFDKLHKVPPDCGLVIDSRMERGVGADWLCAFKKRSTIVHMLEYTGPHTDPDLYTTVVREMAGRGYDERGVGWLTWDSILLKLGHEGTRGNRWNAPDDVFCTEVAGALRHHIRLPDAIEWDPHTLYEGLVTHNEFSIIKANL